MTATPLRYNGHLHLRTRLVLSILSGKPVRIDGIRSTDKDPGLRGTWQRLHMSPKCSPPFCLLLPDFEASLLRLLEKITNGTVIEISYTGQLPVHANDQPLTPLSRHVRASQTRDYRWRPCHARLPPVTLRRILPRAHYHARTVREEAIRPDHNGCHDRRPGFISARPSHILTPPETGCSRSI